MLAVVGTERLAHALFPLGDAASKEAVRDEAAARGLTVARKPDSHDICFIPDGDTRGWLDSRIERRPGEVRDLAGAVVGSHDGAQGYTVGQRRGLRLGTPAADGMPRYVLDVSVADNTVTVGPAEALLVDRIEAGRPVFWLGPVPAAGARLSAQVRAHGEPVPVVVEEAGPSVWRCGSRRSLRRVAPGQTRGAVRRPGGGRERHGHDGARRAASTR